MGEIRSMGKGKVELKTDDMGTLQIEWGSVAQVTAPEYFEVEDMEGASTSAPSGRARPRALFEVGRRVGRELAAPSCGWPGSSS